MLTSRRALVRHERIVRVVAVLTAITLAGALACGDDSPTDPAPEPALIVSASSASFEAPQQSGSVITQTVAITNAAAGELTGLDAAVAHSSGQPTGWLDATLSGTTTPSTLTLTAGTGTLAPGTYTATVSVSSDDANNSPRSIAVTLVVSPAPVISLSETSKTFSAPEDGANPAAASISITNAGGAALTGLTVTTEYLQGSASGWLTATLTPNGGIAPSTLTLFADQSHIPAGNHNATVTIASPDAVNGAQTVMVALIVTPTAIYVSANDASAADDATCGAPYWSLSGMHPCRSIAQGIARAVQIGRSRVKVAGGHYAESVTLVNGISLLGEYDPMTWRRFSGSSTTTISGVSTFGGSHDRTVLASGITASTVFEGFVVRGPINSKTGGNSYAIYVANSSANLIFLSNRIEAGRGGPGAAGSVGADGATGVDGTGRESNPPGYDAKTATDPGVCNASNNRQYLNGGLRTAGVDDISGGRGGGNSCPPAFNLVRSASPGLAGQAGAGSLGGAAGSSGAAGFDARLEPGTCYVPTSGPMDGTNGGNGSDGANGTGAAGAVDAGSVSGGHWSGSPGGTATSGGNGGGGGGGGAGGGWYCQSCVGLKDGLGGHGGGGGSGGGGGGGGGGGTAGGGAFGIFVVGTSGPTVTSNTIIRGDGGMGGPGGYGGIGGDRGYGANGGVVPPPIFCAGAGGRGGDGGRGGHGGGGGGGAGGASYAIYTSGIGTPNYCAGSNNTISGGAAAVGGAGGGSRATAGGSGSAGSLGTCSFNP